MKIHMYMLRVARLDLVLNSKYRARMIQLAQINFPKAFSGLNSRIRVTNLKQSCRWPTLVEEMTRRGKKQWRATTSEVGVDDALSRFRINANRSMLVVGGDLG
jgi:hypothetical protein